MNNINLEDLCFIRRLDNFDSIKQEVLDAIESMETTTCVGPVDNISNTDYYLPNEIHRPYHNILMDKFIAHKIAMGKDDRFIFNAFKIGRIWYQQYKKGDMHGLHLHGDCAYSNVLYLELPNKEAGTKFVINGKEYLLDVSEGDILSFPGILPHGSTYSVGGRKTVVVFNTIVGGDGD